MIDQYEIHKDITKELLDSIKMGDLVKVNDWKKPMHVKGVSENYFVMARHQFGECVYSVCEKKPREASVHNEMMPGKFHVGTDHWVFGAPVWCDFGDGSGKYDFDNTEATAAYLATFELSEDSGDIRRSGISERSGMPINTLYIKRAWETGCVYCINCPEKITAKKERYSHATEMGIAYDNIKVNFCPMCGKRLEEHHEID